MSTENNNTTDTTTEDVSGLKAKNADLVRRLKAAEQRAEAAEAEAETAKDEASTAAGDELTKLQRAYNKLEKQVEALTTERDTLSGDLRTVRVDNAVKDALAANNVRPELVPAVEALLLRQVEYTDGVATISGKEIADYAKSYFASKEGSYLVRAAESSGSGSTGSTSQKAGPKPFNETEYSIQRKTDPAGADAWARSTDNAWIIPASI